MSEPSTPREVVPSQTIDARPRAGCIFFMLPVVLTGAIILSYVVIMGAGAIGFSATGERVIIDFDTCSAAQPMIQERVLHMGLGEPVWEGTKLTATLPDNFVADYVPTTLARTGALRFQTGEDLSTDTPVIGNPDISKAEFSLKELGNPLLVITLNSEGQKRLEKYMEDNVEQDLSVWIDDERIMLRPNDPPFRRAAVDIRAEGDDGQDNLRRAADWGMLLTYGPLPCPASVRSITPIQSEESS